MNKNKIIIINHRENRGRLNLSLGSFLLFNLFEMQFFKSTVVPVFELILGSSLKIGLEKLPSFPMLVEELNQFQILFYCPF